MTVTIIDEEAGQVIVRQDGDETCWPLETADAFTAVSRAWLRAGWDAKYVYSFTWLGRPVIQLPEDLIRLQEVIYRVRPDVLVETGIAHGGSLVFYASLFNAMQKGRVIGVDIDIRPYNRKAIERHELFPLITLVEGSSTDASVVRHLHQLVSGAKCVMAVLDSNHSFDHVLAELRHYSKLITVDSYIVVADGIMKDLVKAPRSQPDWSWNNPHRAVQEFLAEAEGFVQEEPKFEFNEGAVNSRVTYWPNAFLKRLR